MIGKKQKTMKRIMAWLVAICMILGAVHMPMNVNAAEQTVDTRDMEDGQTAYHVSLPEGEGYEVCPWEGYTTEVSKGADFKFVIFVNGEDGYSAASVVKSNGTALTADADHVYTIENISEDQEVTVEGIQQAQYTVSFPKEQEGYSIELLDGPSAPSGGSVSFQMNLDEKYADSNPVVKTDEDVELTPDENGVYTIANITGDLAVGVEGISANSRAAVSREGTSENVKNFYLSDMDWKSAVNSDGAAGEKETPTKDLNHGQSKIKLLVNGTEKEFEKGIGTQTNSEIVYDLAGRGYASFHAIAGVDHSQVGMVGGEGCDVIFKVLVDGEEKFNSGTLDASMDAVEVNIPLTEENRELKLVTDKVVNPYNDWGNWADAYLVMPYPEPENLALNKTVTVKKTADNTDSEVNPDKPGSMAVDGIIECPASYCDFGADGDDSSRYLQIDLGEIYELSQINMWRYWLDGRTYNGTVIASSKKADFSEPSIIYNSDTANKHGLGAGSDSTYPETTAGKEFSVPAGTEARYIRVYMAGSNSGSTNHVVEVQVMGYKFSTEPKPYEANALENADTYFDLPTHYDTSDHVAGQVTHPDIVIMDEPWNGFKYWMVYTPNVMLTSRHEQPSIVASNDGVNWEEVATNNPIEAEPVSTRYHNNDADLVYDPVNDRMMAFWKWDDDQAGGVGAEIRVRISYDGRKWGKPTDSEGNIATTADTVANMDDNDKTGFITVIQSSNRYDMQSPTFTYDEHRGIFVMWAANAGDVGYNNGQRNFVEMSWSEDGLTWSERTKVNNFLGKNEAGQQLAPWHQDIQYIPEFQEYWGLSQCFAGGSPDGSVLYLTKSKDGVNWEPVGTKPILNAGETGAWDDFQIYRSTFYYDSTGAQDPKQGTLRVWYSALQKDTAGKMVIDSNGEKTIQATIADTRIWRIGYTENTYQNVMKALTKNEFYEEPETVAGQSLNLTLNKPSLTVGETGQLSAAFTPENTSDQVLRYESQNPDIASVDAMGKVTGLKDGTATIKAVNRSGLTGEIMITVGELQKGTIRHHVGTDSPLYLENYYWSDDAPSKNGLNANTNYDDENRIDSPVKLYEAVPDSLKENTVILLIAERSLNNTDAIREWIKRNVELCNENQVPCAVQIANGETNVNNTIPLSFWNELARDNEYLYGFNAAEMYNRFAGDNREYVMDVIRVGIPYGVTMMWTDTNIFGKNGVIYDWLTQDDQLANLMRDNKEYISLMTKESYGGQAANTDALFMGMWLTEYCSNWGIASDWWHWQLDGNGALFDGSGGDAWKQCLTWPENMYTQDVVMAASQGATCFKSEAQWYSNATKGMRTPTYQYSMIPFLEKLVNGEVKIPTREEVLARTKAIVVGAENWNNFNYDTAYSNLYPKTGQYGIVPFVPSSCPEEELDRYELVVRENYGKDGLKKLLDTVYPVQKSEGSAYMETFGDTWYWMNSSEDKDVKQYTEFTTAINGSDRVRIEGEPHVFGIIKESPDALNVYLSNYRLDKTELWDGTYPGGFSDQSCYNYVWEMCERMKAGTGHDEQKRDTVITVKNAVKPQLRFITQSPEDRSYQEDNYIRPYSYTIEKKTDTEDEWVITVSHNGVVEFDIVTGDKDVPAQKVELSTDHLDVIRNRTASVQATVLPGNAGNKQLTWTVKDETIAKVDSKGTVTGLKEGTTTLKAAVSDSIYAECEVEVTDLKVTEVQMSQENVTLTDGDSAQLSATALPEDNSDASITWSSTNENVATVTSTGKVTAHEPGVTQIIAQSAYAAKGVATVTVDYSTSARLDRTGMTAKASSAYGGSNEGPAANVLDDDMNTWWHTFYPDSTSVEKPHWIEIDLGETKHINQFAYTPRTSAANGTILKYVLSYKDKDGNSHNITQGTWERNDSIKTVTFDPVEATAIRITAGTLDSEGNLEAYKAANSVGGFGSAAEINIYEVMEKPTAEEVAENIKEIAPVKQDDESVTLPVLKGYTVTIAESSNPAVVAANGTITNPEEDTEVTLKLRIIDAENSGEAITTVKVQIPGVKVQIVEPDKVELDKTEAQLTIGDTLSLTATVSPAEAQDKSVTWSSSDSSVASVKDGVVTAESAGNAEIKATTVNGKYAVCKVTVKEADKPVVEPIGITISQTSVGLTAGESMTLTATVLPAEAQDKSVTWSSSDSGIASVKDGLVTAVAKGTAVITAATANGKQASCTVNVTEKPAPAVSLSGAKLGTIVSQKHTGKALTPEVIVTYGTAVLKRDTDYTVSYKNNVNPGTATVTVTGTGGYYGSLSGSFTILAAKGKTYKIGKAYYKVTNAAAKNGTVTFVKPDKKTYKTFSVPSTVKIGKYTYKVTEIGKNAFRSQKKLVKVTIGSNVRKIGAYAFYGSKRLKNVVIKSRVLKSVGKNAFRKIYAKATVKVPGSKLKNYKKVLKGKGLSNKARIKR